MPSDSGDSRMMRTTPNNNNNNNNNNNTGSGTQPSEQDSLPCPRCDSINTKFCYYNNYNLSQPRHFCKSCRRYWTQGGTLRNIPVGGGTRKSAKRSRTSSPTTPSSAVSSPKQNSTTTLKPNVVSSPAVVVSSTSCCNTNTPDISVSSAVKSDMSFPICYDLNLNNNANHSNNLCSGSFTSLLQTHGGGGGGGGGPSPAPSAGGFLALGGFGLGLGSGFEDVGFELGRGIWAPLEEVGHGGSDATWHVGGGDHGGYVDGGDQFFGWPDLAISTTGKGLK